MSNDNEPVNGAAAAPPGGQMMSADQAREALRNWLRNNIHLVILGMQAMQPGVPKELLLELACEAMADMVANSFLVGPLGPVLAARKKCWDAFDEARKRAPAPQMPAAGPMTPIGATFGGKH